MCENTNFSMALTEFIVMVDTQALHNLTAFETCILALALSVVLACRGHTVESFIKYGGGLIWHNWQL